MHLIRRRYLPPSLVHLVAWLCAWLLLWTASSTRAQDDQILVVSGEKVADNVSEAVSDALADVGSVMSPSSYTSKLRGREPDSEEALTQVAPQTGASLVVVLRHARSKVKIELRSGRDGKVVGHASAPARAKRPKLAKPAQKRLVAAAKRALKKIGPAPVAKRAAPASSSDDESDFADEPAPQPSRAAATSARQPVKPVRPIAPVEQASDDDDEGEEEGFGQGGDSELASDDEPAERDKSKASSEGGIAIRLHAGLGLGSRSILVPTPPGKGVGNKVDTSFVPALDLGAALEVPLGPKWVLRFAADYRTIVGLSAGYLTATNMMATSSLSSHSLVAGASLGRLSDGRDSFGVHVFLGWAYRGLSSDQPSLPSASMQGLALRPEVEIPIWDRKLALRLAPELIVILAPSATLPANDSALAKAVGYGFGGEISLDLHLSRTFGLSAQFRESHGSTPSGWGVSAVENERYLALRLLLQF